MISAGAQIIDKAIPSGRPSSPNYYINIGVGFLAALLGGIGMAFIVAFLDDRAKSSYDIETIIGVPLLGIVPRVKRLNSSEKAQIAASNADRTTMEAFRALHSAMKVNSASKNAKVILFTSTMPSEGKSFAITNLAFTSSIHGEKTIVIDADFRLPAIAKTLGIESETGLISYMEGKSELEIVIHKDYFPNMDVLCCERRAPNPTQIINSEKFVKLIEELKTRYDRIFVDSPPIGAVSDVISLLPIADGVMYVVKFNSIKRKTIKAYVRRIMETNTPVLGAIMNMVNLSSTSLYSTNYYDKQYKDYYTTPPAIEDDTPQFKGASKSKSDANKKDKEIEEL